SSSNVLSVRARPPSRPRRSACAAAGEESVYGLRRSRLRVLVALVMLFLQVKSKTSRPNLGARGCLTRFHPSYPRRAAFAVRSRRASFALRLSIAKQCRHLSAAVTGRPVGHTCAGKSAFWFTLAGGFPCAS